MNWKSIKTESPKMSYKERGWKRNESDPILLFSTNGELHLGVACSLPDTPHHITFWDYPNGDEEIPITHWAEIIIPEKP